MKSAGARPRIAGPLGVIAPDLEETSLLRACLSDKAEAAAGWQTWTASRPDLRQAVAGRPWLKRLLPILHLALVEARIDADEETQAILRAAALWEAQRAAEIRRILSETLDALTGASVVPILVSGQALSETAYPGPSVRHCHDIDLFVAQDDLAPATRALVSRGFLAVDSSRPSRSSTGFVHRGGLPIYLHRRLISSSLLSVPQSEMVTRSVAMTSRSQTVRVLSPIDMFFHLCGRVASGAVSEPVKWVVDVVFLLKRSPPTSVEWDWLIEAAEPGGLTSPLLVMLSYLHEAMGVSVPEDVLTRLGRRARHTRLVHRDVLLETARRARSARLRTMFQEGDWPARLDLMRWLVAPSRRFLDAWCEERGVPPSPVWYLGRPLRAVATKAGFRRRATAPC